MFKDKKYKIILLISSVTSIVSLCLATYLFLSRPKLGFVYNAKILNEYRGTKEGQKIYQDRSKALTANLDTLESEINSMLKKYQKEYKGLSEKEKQLTTSLIKRRQNDYYNYKKAIDEKIKEEDNQLSSSVLKQIDNYVVEYAKKYHYNYIFGSSNEGSLFFAPEKDDLTEEILKGLNDAYSGKVQ